MTIGIMVECYYALSFMLTVTHGECSKLALYAECHYTECRYAEYRGTRVNICS